MFTINCINNNKIIDITFIYYSSLPKYQQRWCLAGIRLLRVCYNNLYCNKKREKKKQVFNEMYLNL